MPGSSSSAPAAPALSGAVVRVAPRLATLFDANWNNTAVTLQRLSQQQQPPQPQQTMLGAEPPQLSAQIHTRQPHVVVYRGTATLWPIAGASVGSPAAAAAAPASDSDVRSSSIPPSSSPSSASPRQQALQIPVLIKCIAIPAASGASASGSGGSGSGALPLPLLRELHHSLKLEWLLFHHHSKLSLQASRAAAGAGASAQETLDRQQPLSLKNSAGTHAEPPSHYKLASASDAPVAPSPSAADRPIDPSVPAHYRLGLLGPLGFPRWVAAAPVPAPASPHNNAISAPSLQATVDPTDPVWPRVAAATISAAAAAASALSASPQVMRSTNLHSGLLLSNSSHERHARAASARGMLPTPALGALGAGSNAASPESPPGASLNDLPSPSAPPAIPFAEMVPQGGWSDGTNSGGGWPTNSQPAGSLDRASLTLVLPDVGGESLDRLIAARLFTDVPAPATVSPSLPAVGTPPTAPTLHVRLVVFLRAALAIVDQLCALHSMGIISKALRPSSISYNPVLHLAQLLDFSQATLLAKENMAVSWVGSNIGAGGAMLHVPPHQRQYMSPEESGRVSRVIDARADIYQFGMVMFEMLVGRPAFATTTTMTTAAPAPSSSPAAAGTLSASASSSGLSALDESMSPPPAAAEEDVMAIIHAHLAREPVFPPHIQGPRSNVLVDITDVASFRPPSTADAFAGSTPSQHGLSAFVLVKKIILTCLCKMAEDRYSSAAGLRADLLYVLGLLSGKDPRPSFKVGHMDRHSTFMISQKLYGREVQQQAMLECFERAARSGRGPATGSGSGSGGGGVSKKKHQATGPHILLVSGYSGIGKTALIELMHRPMLQRSAIYSKAKFDLYRRSHSAIFLAFDALFAHFAVAAEEGASGSNGGAAVDAHASAMLTEPTRSKVHGSKPAGGSGVLEPTLPGSAAASNSSSWKRQLLAALDPKQLQMLVAVMPNLALLVGMERTAATAATTKDANSTAASRALRIQLSSNKNGDNPAHQEGAPARTVSASPNPTTPALSTTATPSAPVAPTTELAPIEAQNLFVAAFLALVAVFATSAHPLVLFLDDVQWIDSISLDLLRKLHGHRKLTMLIICAYRSNEVDPLHSFIRTIQSLADTEKTEADRYVTASEANSGRDLFSHSPPPASVSAGSSDERAAQAQLSIRLSPRIQQVVLPPLSKEHVVELIKDTAGIVDEPSANSSAPAAGEVSGTVVASANSSSSSLNPLGSPMSAAPSAAASVTSDVNALAELLHDQTGGNPFFIANLLMAYVDEGLIRFDFDALRWTWSIDQLRVTKLAHLDSVIDLLCGVVAQLPARHQTLLQRAACVGNTATLQQLAIISEASEVETAQHIFHLCQLGFLVPLQPASAIFAVATSTALTPVSASASDPAAVDAPVSSTPNPSSVASQPSSSAGVLGPQYPVLSFRFLHDAVQQSCYQLMSPHEAKLTHLRIARLFDAQGSTMPIPALHAQLAPKYTQAFLLLQHQSQSAADPTSVHSSVAVSQSAEWSQLVYDIVEQYNLPARDYLQRAQQHKASPSSPPVPARQLSGGSSPSSLSLSAPEEIKRIIELNLISGIGAKAATAYAHAIRYLTLAYELWSHLEATRSSSGADGGAEAPSASLWTSDHDLSVDLHVHFIQCLTMNDLFERAEQLSTIALAHVEHAPVAERVRILRTQVSMYILQQSRTRDSLKVGLQILPLLGIELPDPSSPESTALRLRDPSIFLSPTSAPLMRDPFSIEVCDIMVSLLAPCFQLGELAIMERILLQLLAMSYELGVHASTAFMLVMKMYFDWREEAMDASRLSGKVSQLLVYERSDLRASSSAYMRIRVISLYHHFSHWFVPLSEMLPTMLDCVTEGVSCGETEYAGYVLWIWIYLRFYRGEPLTALAHALRSLRASLLKQRRHLHASYCHYTLRMILHLQTAPVFSLKHSEHSTVDDDPRRDGNGGAAGVQFVTLSNGDGNDTTGATPTPGATPASLPKQRILAEAKLGSHAHNRHHHAQHHRPKSEVPSTFEFNGHVFRDSDVEAFLIAGSSSTWLCHLYELYMIWAYLHRCWPQAWEERERARPLLNAMAGMYDHSVNNFYGSLILLEAVDMKDAAIRTPPATSPSPAATPLTYDAADSDHTASRRLAAQTAKNTEANSSMHGTQILLDPLTGKPVQLGTWTSALPSLDIDYAATFSYESVMAQVASNQRLLHLWAQFSPSSFQHKADLVDAEWMRVRYQYEGAHELLLLIMDRYDAAIRGARRYGFLQERAMASECAARFYLSLRPPRQREAKRHMESAYRSYRKWNCLLKMELLVREFPYLREMDGAAAATRLSKNIKQPMLHPTPGIVTLRNGGTTKESSGIKNRNSSPSPDRVEIDRAAARSSRRKRVARSSTDLPLVASASLSELPAQLQPHGRMGSSTSHGRNASAQHAARGDRGIMMGGQEMKETRAQQGEMSATHQSAATLGSKDTTQQHGTDDESAVSMAEQSDGSPASDAHLSDDSDTAADVAGKESSNEEDDEKGEDADTAFGRSINLSSPRQSGGGGSGGGGNSTSGASSEVAVSRRPRMRGTGDDGQGFGQPGASNDSGSAMGGESPLSTQDASVSTPVRGSADRYSLTRISSSDYSTSEEMTRRRRRGAHHSHAMIPHDPNDKNEGPGVDINLLSVMRATQAFSVITDSKLLHQTLLRIVLQASCASRARLILRQEAPLTSTSPDAANEEEDRLFVPRLSVSLADESVATTRARPSSSSAAQTASAAVPGPSSTPSSPTPAGSPEWAGEHEHIYVQELSGQPEDLGQALPLSVHKMALNSRSAVLLNFDDIASERGLFGMDPYFAKFRIPLSNAASQANSGSSGSNDGSAGDAPSLKRDAAAGTLNTLYPIPQSPASSFGSVTTSLDGVSSVGDGATGWRGPRSSLYIPLIRQGYVCGALYFEHDHYARDGFSTQHIQLLQQLGAQAVLSMDNARLYSRMRHAMEEAESGSRAKSSFLQNMSHEIRTPLNAILGAAAMLSDFDIPPEQMQLVEMLQASGQLLLSIISDILDLSRIESGSLTLEQRPFRLGETLEDVLHMLYAFAQQRRLDLTLHMDPDLPDALIGDAIHLQQVAINLVNNSLKFTQRGGVKIEVKQITHEAALEDAAQHHGAPLQTVIHTAAQRRATSDGSAASGGSATPLPSPPQIWLRISVRDTGIGVAADVIPKLFSSFVQADASTVRRFGGSGLGLAISKRLVCAMGGCIWMESQEGVGTVVHLDVPFFAVATNSAFLPTSPPTHNIMTTPTKSARQHSAGKSPRTQDLVTANLLAMRGSSDSAGSPLRGGGSGNSSAASSRHNSPALSSKQHPPLNIGSPAMAMSLFSPLGSSAVAPGSCSPPIPRRLEATAIRYDLSPLAIHTLRDKRVLVICPLDASRQMTVEILQSVGMRVAATASLNSVASNYSELCAMASPKRQGKGEASQADSTTPPAVPWTPFDLVLFDMFDPQTCAAETAELVALFTHPAPSSHSNNSHSSAVVPTPTLLCAMLPLRQTSPFGVARSFKTNSSRLFPSTPASLVQIAAFPVRTAASPAFQNRSVSAPQRRSSLDEVQEGQEADGLSSSPPDANVAPAAAAVPAAMTSAVQSPPTGDSAEPLVPSPPVPLAGLHLPVAAGQPLRTASEVSADEQPLAAMGLPPLHAPTDSHALRQASQASQSSVFSSAVFSSASSASSAPAQCGLLELHKPLKTCLLLQLLAAHLASALAAKNTHSQQQSLVSPSSRPLPSALSSALLNTSSFSDQQLTPDGSLIFPRPRGSLAPTSVPHASASNLETHASLESAVAVFSPVLPDHVIDRAGPALFSLSLPSSASNSVAASPISSSLATATAVSHVAGESRVTGSPAVAMASPSLSMPSTPATDASTPHSSLLYSASSTPSATAAARSNVTLLGSGQGVDYSAMSSPSSRSRTLRSSGATSSHAMSNGSNGAASSSASADATAVSSASSAPGAGPMSKSAAAAGRSSKSACPAPLLFASCPLNVLLVDDNPVNLKMLSMVLRKQGYSCDTAANGQIAIEKVEAKWAEDEARLASSAAPSTPAAATPHASYDLIVMDICMDVMDGLECTSYLRSHQRAWPALRPFIIAHTADSTPESKARCAAAGAECFLPKPFHQDQLIAFIKQAYAYHQKRAAEAGGSNGTQVA